MPPAAQNARPDRRTTSATERLRLVVSRVQRVSSVILCSGNVMLTAINCEAGVLAWVRVWTECTNQRWNARAHSGQAPLMHRSPGQQESRAAANLLASGNRSLK